MCFINSFQAVFICILINLLINHETDGDPLPSEDLNTLELVHIIFRHGNRTPFPEFYKFDPYRGEKYYPFGMAELNLDGKKNAYNLGMEIRERYNGFLPEIYFPPDIKAYTSNTSRTQMTLQSVLAGMFPPVWPYVFLPYLMWQPISYETLANKEDNLIKTSTLCPEIYNYKSELNASEQELYNYVRNCSGSKMNNSYDFMKIYNTILVEKENGFDVPAWADEIFHNGEMEAAALNYWQDMIDKKLPIIVGGLIKKITIDSEAKTKKLIDNKIFLYSGHDLNVAALLGAFDSYDNTAIEYTSHIFIELHNIDGIYGFKVYFKNGFTNPLIPLTFKQCTEDFCPMEQFVMSTKDLYIPEPQCQ